ncbi:MAG: potassium channel family protein, partial [bacterium]
MIENDIYSLKNFIAVLLSLILLLLTGMVGYMAIEGWDWHEALYMTFITFSTVGYSEVKPLHWSGQLFSMIIILTGLIILAMFSANVTSFLVKREFLTTFKIKKMRKEIEKLSNHTILCGAGETGKTVINEFLMARKPLVVIEENAEVIDNVKEAHSGLRILHGDATKDEILTEANIETASGLITALSEDTANLFVVISARALKPDLSIVARAVDQHTASKMYKSGATHVISPNLTEGMRMAATVLRPTVVSFLDVMSKDDDLGLRLEEFTVKRGSSFAGKELRELEIPSRTGLIVLGVKKHDTFTYNPQSTTRI